MGAVLASRTGSEYVTLLPMCTNKCCPLYWNMHDNSDSVNQAIQTFTDENCDYT